MEPYWKGQTFVLIMVEKVKLVQLSVQQVLNWNYFNGLVQDCDNFSVLAMELLQSCTKIDGFVLTHWGRVTYMHQLTRPSLVQIMACRPLGAKPLSEPMLGYC